MGKILSLVAFAFVLLWGMPGQSQSRSAASDPSIRLGQSIVVLNGPWRFHIGDDPAWASPQLDDANWERVDLSTAPGSFDPIFGNADFTGGWTARGHAGYAGFAWYRLKIKLDSLSGPVSLMMPDNVDDSYQVFTNGKYIGQFGDFDGRVPRSYNSRALDFQLPPLDPGQPVTIALRFWMAGSTLTSSPDSGGLHGPPQIGLTPVADALTRLRWDDVLHAYASRFVLIFLFLGIAGLLAILHLMDRTEPIFLWLSGVYFVLTVEETLLIVGAWTMLINNDILNFRDILVIPLILGGWLMAWSLWFDLRGERWLTRLIVIATVANVITMACMREPLLGWIVPLKMIGIVTTLSILIRLGSAVLLGIIVALGIRRQGRESWLILAPVALLIGALFQTELQVIHVRTTWFPGGTQLTLSTMAQIGLSACIFILLLRRFQRSQRRQLLVEQDLKQAQQVQKLLMPEQNAVVPGFSIESEYRPAQQVGGDFFQVIPGVDGSVLIAIGDVAGKGAQAGILVGLLVGTIRTCVQLGLTPSAIMDTLNQRLCGREQALATCLVMRIGAGGEVAYVNAGHLPPYLNGKELPIEGALPLGVLLEMVFPAGHFLLAPGDRLLLMSDGVVEATNAEGKLFGFERLQEMLLQPVSAAAVAQRAQEFGQQDDVLVLRIVRNETERITVHEEPMAVVG